MISNIKSNIEGTYHGLDNHYLQNYLDEFCFLFNRRNLNVYTKLKIVLKVCIYLTTNKAQKGIFSVQILFQTLLSIILKVLNFYN